MRVREATASSRPERPLRVLRLLGRRGLAGDALRESRPERPLRVLRLLVEVVFGLANEILGSCRDRKDRSGYCDSGVITTW